MRLDLCLCISDWVEKEEWKIKELKLRMMKASFRSTYKQTNTDCLHYCDTREDIDRQTSEKSNACFDDYQESKINKYKEFYRTTLYVVSMTISKMSTILKTRKFLASGTFLSHMHKAHTRITYVRMCNLGESWAQECKQQLDFDHEAKMCQVGVVWMASMKTLITWITPHQNKDLDLTRIGYVEAMEDQERPE